jgi:hypothetical protein
VGAHILCDGLAFRTFPGLEFHESGLPNRISPLAPALLSEHGLLSRNGVNALGLPALTDFPIHAGVLRLGVFRNSMDNPRADALAHHRVTKGVQDNFHPILSTKLYEQSGNTVHDLMLGNLQLGGNLIVCQTDRDEAYQLLVYFGQLYYLLITSVHIISAHVDSCAT